MDHVDRGYEGLETALAALGETFAGRPARKAEQETPASADAGKGTERPPWDRGGVSAC
ncbi:MAG: hypothetical protein ACLR1T_18125 [Evtepia gabavorous]